MTTKTPYVIDTVNPTNGPWRVSECGNRYANVTMADGRKLFIGVEQLKRVRIPYKPRGTYGWTYYGFVRDVTTNREIAGDRVNGNLGVRGLLKLAGVI